MRARRVFVVGVAMAVAQARVAKAASSSGFPQSIRPTVFGLNYLMGMF
jgi:hypothetical protein